MLRYILVLEDDQTELARLQHVIQSQLPVAVFPVYNADAVMELLDDSSDRFMAYVLDIEMIGQKYSGIQVAEKIRQLPGCAVTPIIFLTSYSHFGAGALRHIHYYDFLSKPCDTDVLISLLRSALSLSTDTPATTPPKYILLNGLYLSCEICISDISCIEIAGSDIAITDFMGNVKAYRVKSKTFANICEQLKQLPGHSLRQIHRSVIINVDRIKKIQWQKNTAMVWLFNVSEWKPVGKTFLNDLAIYNK